MAAFRAAAHAISGLALVAGLAAALPARALTYDLFKLWAHGGTLKVCFYNGGAERELVQGLASEWTRYGANLKFDFGTAPAYRACSSAEFTPIRIVFTESTTWTYPGPGAAQSIPRNKPTMSLGILGRASAAGPNEKRLVLQEFGHLLGFLFEEQNPGSKCLDSVDWKKAEAAFGRKQGEFLAGANEKRLATAPDAASIMALGMRAQLAAGAAADACPDAGGFQLTALDKDGMKQAYPAGKSQLRSLNGAVQPVPATALRTLLEEKVGFSDQLSSVIAEMDSALPPVQAPSANGPALTLARLALSAVNDMSGNPDDAVQPFVAYFVAGNYAEGREAANKAIRETRDPRAALVLAAVNLTGFGQPHDPDKASTWVRMAGESKSAAGALLLGYALLNGVGENENAREALALLAAAEKGGQPAAAHVLGALYYSGRFVQLNYAAARDHFARGAELGFAPSQRALAVMRDQGLGADRDEAGAVAMATSAANSADDIGRMLLGIMTADTPGANLQALALLQLAAAGGAPLPNAVLGAVNEAGQLGLAADRAKAIEYYALAEGLRSSRLWLRLAELHLQGGDDGKPKALEMYRKAAEAGSVAAQLKMGELYRDGFGVGAAAPAPAGDADPYPVPRDPGRSLAWYTLASLYGSETQRQLAQAELQKIYAVISRAAWFTGTDFAMARVRQRDKLLQQTASVVPAGATASEAMVVKDSGSAVIIDPKGYLLTNAHVVEDCAFVRVRLEGSAARLNATVPYTPNRKAVDLALLKLEYQPGFAAKFNERIRRQTPVVVFGYPDPRAYAAPVEKQPDGRMITESGEITLLAGPDDDNLFQTSAVINPGNSGGPLFDLSGGLVGIAVLRFEGQQQGAYFAIKASTARNYLEGHDVFPETGSGTGALRPEEVVNQNSRLVGMVECWGQRVRR